MPDAFIYPHTRKLQALTTVSFNPSPSLVLFLRANRTARKSSFIKALCPFLPAFPLSPYPMPCTRSWSLLRPAPSSLFVAWLWCHEYPTPSPCPTGRSGLAKTALSGWLVSTTTGCLFKGGVSSSGAACWTGADSFCLTRSEIEIQFPCPSGRRFCLTRR